MKKLIDILGTIGLIMIMIELPVALFIDIPESMVALSFIFMMVSLIYDETIKFRRRRDSI